MHCPRSIKFCNDLDGHVATQYANSRYRCRVHRLRPLAFITLLVLGAYPILNNATIQGILRTTEVQVWDGTAWKTASEWNNTALPDTASKWLTAWECLDEEWNYVLTRPHQAIRQRTWERTYEVLDDNLSPALPQQQQHLRRFPGVVWRPVLRKPQWVDNLQEDWNFKGLGLSLSKNLLSLDHLGLSLRIPVTGNFDTFERNPALPSMSYSLALHYPWCLAFLCNVSIRLEFIQWAVRRLVEQSIGIILLILWISVVRVVAIMGAAILFPLTRYWPEEFVATVVPDSILDLIRGTTDNAPQYSRTTEERIGWSASWRISRARGYEFRSTYWHLAAPRLSHWWDRLPRRIGGSQNTIAELGTTGTRQSDSAVGETIRSLPAETVAPRTPPPAWMIRRSAACGISTSFPIPNAVPPVGCSAVLSLSGFQFPSWNPPSIPNMQVVESTHDDEASYWWQKLLFPSRSKQSAQDENADEEDNTPTIEDNGDDNSRDDSSPNDNDDEELSDLIEDD